MHRRAVCSTVFLVYRESDRSNQLSRERMFSKTIRVSPGSNHLITGKEISNSATGSSPPAGSNTLPTR